MSADCQTCEKQMPGADDQRRCRRNGLVTEPGSDLDKYVQRHGCFDFEPRDEQPWYAGGWDCGRGD